MLQNSLNLYLVCLALWISGALFDIFSTIYCVRVGLRESNPLARDKETGKYLPKLAAVILAVGVIVASLVQFLAPRGNVPLTVNLLIALVGLVRMPIALSNYGKYRQRLKKLNRAN